MRPATNTSPRHLHPRPTGLLSGGVKGVVALFFVASLATACGQDKGSQPGDRCREPGDCDAPLVCSNANDPPGTLGICVYPEAVPDAAPPDAAFPDAAFPDAETADDAQARDDAQAQDDAQLGDDAEPPDAES